MQNPNDKTSNDKSKKDDKGFERAGDVYSGTVDGRGGNIGGRDNHNNIHNVQEASFQDKLRTIKAMRPYTDKAAAYRALSELFGMKEPIEEMLKLRNTLEAQIEQDMRKLTK